MNARSALRDKIYSFIDDVACDASNLPEREELLTELARFQLCHIESYAAIARHRPDEKVPPIPTDVFRHARIACHAPSADIRTFISSGTTQSHRSHHHFQDLGLYTLAARKAAAFALFPDRPRMHLLMLAPHEDEAPHSSLSFMLSRFADWFGLGEVHWAWRDDQLCASALTRALKCAQATSQPLAILGTSFAFVHAEELLEKRRYKLPRGSRIMQTGGFKGRSRSYDPPTLRAMLSQRYGIRDSHIISEYGMTELSSQLYETTLRQVALGLPEGPRLYWHPPWMRVRAVDPETLIPVSEGDSGLLRLDDLANLDSCVSIQTSDHGRVLPEGIELLGRDPNATPRGCSITADIALGAIP